MSNPSTGYGFKPLRYLNGAPWNQQTMPYLIPTTPYATSIFRFDIVKFINSGLLNLSTANDQPRGVFMGCSYIDATGKYIKSAYWPASQTIQSGSSIVADVIDDPNIVMSARALNSSSAVTQANMGELVALYAGSGVTGTGQSTMGLDLSSTGTSAKAYRLLRFVNEVDNDTASANPMLEVAYATHDFKVITGI